MLATRTTGKVCRGLSMSHANPAGDRLHWHAGACAMNPLTVPVFSVFSSAIAGQGSAGREAQGKQRTTCSAAHDS